MTVRDRSTEFTGRHTITLEGAPRLLVLDADTFIDSGQPDERVLQKLVLLAEETGAQVALRGVSQAGQQRLDALTRGWRVPPWLALAGAAGGLSRLLGRASVPPQQALLFLSEGTEPPPAGSHAFYLGDGAPPAGAVAARVPGPRGTDALLALYGTALVQERAGHLFRAASRGQPPPTSAPFAAGLFQGMIAAFGRPAKDEALPVPPAPKLDDGRLRALAAGCWARIQANLQPNGALVAAPAKGEQPGQPNYWFVWQRDAGQTLLGMLAWAQQPPFGLSAGPIQAAITSYVGFLTRAQAAGNLGFSRYSVDGQPIGGYGNPQLDGPAISALGLLHLPDPRPFYPQIRALLEYLRSPEGQGPCYDAWEFVFGRIFNALLLKRKAFRRAARLASLLNEDGDARRYQAEVHRLESELEAFSNDRRGSVPASLEPADPWLATISGLDASTLGALLTAWDASDDVLNLAHPAVMGTVLALEDAFAPLYAVNRAWLAAGNAAIGWGRFPEDANDGVGSTGGNPWPLVTLWAAQYCYRLADVLQTANVLPITDQRQADYFNRVTGQALASVGGQVERQSLLSELLPALHRRGDAYVQFVLAHQPPDGALTEQINHETGQPQGARDLTWAQAELLKTLALRAGVVE